MRSVETNIDTTLKSCDLQHDTECSSRQMPPVQKEMDTCSVQVHESNSE